VEVTGSSYYVRRRGQWDWYRYRYPVQILGWYEEDLKRWPNIRFTPPAPGTFQLLTGITPVRKAIEKWLKRLGHALGAAGGQNSAGGSGDGPPDDDESEFPEGKLAFRTHRVRERNAKLVSQAKKNALEQEGRLTCKACGFDFAIKYGKLGKNYIECHHTVPVSELKRGQKTKISDIALLCSNCHRMVHRRKQWLRMGQLSLLLENTRQNGSTKAKHVHRSQ
ncbi:MAG: HNH endonuclease, partial [Candidatus Binataceae bacterium]